MLGWCRVPFSVSDDSWNGDIVFSLDLSKWKLLVELGRFIVPFVLKTS